MQEHATAQGRSSDAQSQLVSLTSPEAHAAAQHQKACTDLETSEAQLQMLRSCMGGLAEQPPSQHRMLFDCFAFKDPAGLQDRGFAKALDAIAGGLAKLIQSLQSSG